MKSLEVEIERVTLVNFHRPAEKVGVFEEPALIRTRIGVVAVVDANDQGTRSRHRRDRNLRPNQGSASHEGTNADRPQDSSATVSLAVKSATGRRY